MLQKKDGQYTVYGNAISRGQTRAVDKWKEMLAKKFSYDPNEKFHLSVEDHPYGCDIFGLKTIVRDGKSAPSAWDSDIIALPWPAFLPQRRWGSLPIGSICCPSPASPPM